MARSNKRKRDAVHSSPGFEENAQDGTLEDEEQGDIGTVAVDSSPFTLTWVKDGGSTPKKSKTKKAQDISEVKLEEGIPEANLRGYYTVSPASQWAELKKYRNFVVNPNNEPQDHHKHKFEVGQHVFVNHDEKPDQIIDNDKASWVAQVKEVRASGQHAVFVRVLWYYWPEELPGGREAYHGERELIASSFHQIIDAMTVSGKALVYHMKDVHDMSAIPENALYWRQTFDIRKRLQRPSALPKECVCRTVLNPDVLAVRCSNASCGKWLHESCLVDAALTRYWEERGTELKSDDKGTVNGVIKDSEADSEIGDTIVATPKASLFVKMSDLGRTVMERLTGSANETPAKKPNRRSSKKSRRGSKFGQVIDKSRPWDGKLTAKLQVITHSDKEQSSEFTGKATIFRIWKEKGEEVREDFDEIEVACLFCGQSMVEADEFDEPVDEVEKKDPNLDPNLFVSQPSPKKVNDAHDGSSKHPSKKRGYDAVHDAATENGSCINDTSVTHGNSKRSDGHLATTDPFTDSN